MTTPFDGELAFTPTHMWQAQWIWSHDDPTIPNTYLYARREFSLPSKPKSATLRVCADTRYQLYVNGTRLTRGPMQSQPYLQYYDVEEIAGALRRGTNCLAFVVNHLGSIPNARGGLLAELEIGGKVVLTTDTTWRMRRADAWLRETFRVSMNKAVPFQEYLDTRKEPEGWNESGFDDDAWLPAVAFGRPPTPPWTYLVPRDIPAMTATPLLPASVVHTDESLAVTHRGNPHDLSRALSTAGRSRRLTKCENEQALCREKGGPAILRCSTEHLERPYVGAYDPAITLDFGRLTTAFIELDVEGPAGAILDVGYAERLTDGRFVNSIEGQFANRFILKGGRQTIRSFGWIGFRFVKLRLRDSSEETQLHAVRAIETTYPFERLGKFACPDDHLNQIWDISRATIQLCCNEFITDTPWREQGQWLGDVSAVTLGGIYTCFGDPRLPGKFLRQSAANQLPTGLITNMTNTVSWDYAHVIPDYSLWWLEALWHHFLFTGDESWVHRYYPHACKVIFAILPHCDAEGIVDRMPGWVFVDWSHVEKQGACAAFNAVFYSALGMMGKLAALKHDARMTALVQEARQKLRAHFAVRFLDPKTGCVVDAVEDGVPSTHFSEAGNLMPILADLLDPAQSARIIDALYVKKSVKFAMAEPFFTWQVLKALDRAGRFDLALEVVRERWGWMIERGSTTCSEEWNLHGSWREGERMITIMRTESHAWSACPAEFLCRTLLGLEILEPGCTRIRLSPHTEQLPTFCVHVPTPLGVLKVTAEEGKVTWKAPKGMTVHLSSAEPTTVSMR